MKISLCTDGKTHYVLGYGKYDCCIMQAPVSILKKILKADCFEFVELINKRKEITPAIQIKETYFSYIDLAINRSVKKSNGISFYSMHLITRENELLRFFGKKWNVKLLKLADLVEVLSQREQYAIGFNFNKIGIQLFIEDGELGPQVKRFEGKELLYPFLLNEFQADLFSLQCQVDDFSDQYDL